MKQYLNKKTIITTILLFVSIGVLVKYAQHKTQRYDWAGGFDGQNALANVEYQLSLGPRTPGSPGHAAIIEWIKSSLEKQNWEVQLQQGNIMGQPITNVISKKGGGEPWLILGAHYDTRIVADMDPKPEKRTIPVDGANDGASGVAVLLEIARVIDDDFPSEIWLVFFDAEDNGNIAGWDWILGSRFFVESLEKQPDAMVLVDMVGDKDLNVFMERYSDIRLKTEIWGHAAYLGYLDHFIPIMKYRIIDDHLPFIQAGIPAVDIIDYDYPYWHTTDDSIDKISGESLKIVGDTLLSWLSTFQ